MPAHAPAPTPARFAPPLAPTAPPAQTSDAADQSRVLDIMESLLAQMNKSQTLPSKDVDVEAVFKSLTLAEAALGRLSEEATRRFCGEGGAALHWLAGLCSWLRTHEDFQDALSVRILLKLLARFLGQDPALDNVAIQKGILTSTTALLGTHANDPLMAKCCVEVLATLSVAESSDSILSRLNTIPMIVETVQKYRDNTSVLEDAITTLALMAKRTRHRRSLTQCKGVNVLVDVLKRSVGMPSLVVATSRFLSSFAVKEECCLIILNAGGIDALIAAFDGSAPRLLPQRTPAGGADAVESMRASVAAALWVCSTDCPDAQAAIFSSGWISTVAASLKQAPDHAALWEPTLGVVRGLSRNSSYRDEVVRLGYISIAADAVRRFPNQTGLLKEACGVFGNLATDPKVRVHLGEAGVIQSVLHILSTCRAHEDRKVAKLALGALSNLASCEENRAVFAKLQPAPALLKSASIFIGNENILEYAIGAISHLSVHETCNHQLITAGAVEALLLFIGDHSEDRDVVSRAVVALRRLLKFSTPAQDGINPEMLQKICTAGSADGNRGVALLVQAFQAHDYDETVAKEIALLLTSLTRLPGLVPVLLAVAAQPCLKAMEVHQNEAGVSDALAGLLSRLPLEEDERWADLVAAA